jgi:hypothetical protein
LRRCSEGHTDPALLDPGDAAFMHDGAVGHHESKAGRHKGRVFDVDRGALRRDVAHYAAHDRTTCRDKARLVDVGPGMLSPFFHGLLPQ